MRPEAVDILAKYEAKTAAARARGSQVKEFSDPSINDLLFIKAVLHPTAKADSRELTRKLITLLCERKICTAEEIYEALECSDKPILRRLRILRQNGFVRRESKKYYLATHRLYVLFERHLDRVCGV